MGHAGPIHAVSRRGLLPRQHRKLSPSEHPAPSLEDLPTTALGLLRWLRQRVRKEADWRNAVDSIRPHTQPLWQRFSLVEKRRFLRHGRPWWDVHRHRIPSDVALRIEGLIQKGQLRVSAARIRDVSEKARERYAVELLGSRGDNHECRNRALRKLYRPVVELRGRRSSREDGRRRSREG